MSTLLNDFTQPGMPDSDTFIHDAALFAAGVLDVHELTSKHGGDGHVVAQRLADPETARAVEARVVMMGLSGELALAENQVLLRKCTSSLLKALDSPDIPTSTVLRIAEFAAKITGMSVPQKDVTNEEKPAFHVNILFTNRPSAETIDVASLEVPSHE